MAVLPSITCHQNTEICLLTTVHIRDSGEGGGGGNWKVVRLETAKQLTTCTRGRENFTIVFRKHSLGIAVYFSAL